jgi:hypothetical protein
MDEWKLGLLQGAEKEILQYLELDKKYATTFPI